MLTVAEGVCTYGGKAIFQNYIFQITAVLKIIVSHRFYCIWDRNLPQSPALLKHIVSRPRDGRRQFNISKAVTHPKITISQKINGFTQFYFFQCITTFKQVGLHFIFYAIPKYNLFQKHTVPKYR